MNELTQNGTMFHESASEPEIKLEHNLRRFGPEIAFNLLIDHACRLGASDVFIATNDHDVEIDLRYLGRVKRLTVLPAETGRHLMAHIRALAGMNTVEKRVPLDGRWTRKLPDGRIVDLRLNTMPTIHGASFAIRLLDRQSQLRSLEQLGFVGPQLGLMTSMLQSPSGLILVTGPTGSGKTTTLYACLQALNDGRRKIHTIEDPVEYALPGLRQSQADEAGGVDFHMLLRSVMRQGPDVIMIGEVRDKETAETAVRAANSGQLVFASLHAPVAAAALQSMLSYGIAPHFLCTSVLGVVGQRLMRTLDPATRVAMDMSHTPEMFEEVRDWVGPEAGRIVYAAPSDAAEEGYIGRTGVFEIMPITPKVRVTMTAMQPAAVIAQEAIAEGMLDFRRAALIKVAQGLTTFDEMCRVVPAGETWVDA